MNNKDIEIFFNDNSRFYYANKYFLRKKSAFIKTLINENDEILEVGIGTGDLAKSYSDGVLTGCDISKNMIARARKTLPASILTVCDAENLHHDSESFTILVASEIIYYLANPQKFLHESKRVLKTGGKLIIIWGNRNYNFLYKIASKIKLRAIDPYSLQTTSRGYLIDLINRIYSNTSLRLYGIGIPGSLNGSENPFFLNISPINGLVIQKH